MLCVRACTFSWVTVFLPGGGLKGGSRDAGAVPSTVFALRTKKVIVLGDKDERFDFLFAAQERWENCGWGGKPGWGRGRGAPWPSGRTPPQTGAHT